MGENSKSLDNAVEAQLLEQKQVSEILTLFSYYLKNHKPLVIFNKAYLKSKIPQEYQNLANKVLLYSRQKEVKQQGGFDWLLALAAKQQPALNMYTNQRSVLLWEGPLHLLEIFKHYLERTRGETKFNSKFITHDLSVRVSLGNLGQKLYCSAKYHLRDKGGFYHILRLAKALCPEFNKYYKPSRRAGK
jgi:hypothetical protein